MASHRNPTDVYRPPSHHPLATATTAFVVAAAAAAATAPAAIFACAMPHYANHGTGGGVSFNTPWWGDSAWIYDGVVTSLSYDDATRSLYVAGSFDRVNGEAPCQSIAVRASR